MSSIGRFADGAIRAGVIAGFKQAPAEAPAHKTVFVRKAFDATILNGWHRYAEANEQ
jgi:hypothetical protein